MMSGSQSYLILSTASPYGSHLPRAALDMGLTAAAFEQNVSIVFIAAGVLQLTREQTPEKSGLKNIAQLIPALKTYEVKNIYVHEQSAQLYGLDETDYITPAEVIDDALLRSLISISDHVMVF